MKRSLKRVNLKEIEVNITPLMDVLTVLLFFLIQTLDVSSITLTPPKDIEMPMTNIKAESIEEAIKIFLGPSELAVDDKVKIKLNKGRFNDSDLENDERTIKLVKEYLLKQQEKRKSFYKDAGSDVVIPASKVIIAADKDLPYGILKRLLHTLSIANYDDYQFIVINNHD